MELTMNFKLAGFSVSHMRDSFPEKFSAIHTLSRRFTVDFKNSTNTGMLKCWPSISN